VAHKAPSKEKATAPTESACPPSVATNSEVAAQRIAAAPALAMGLEGNEAEVSA
jgi:hypothetical protein